MGGGAGILGGAEGGVGPSGDDRVLGVQRGRESILGSVLALAFAFPLPLLIFVGVQAWNGKDGVSCVCLLAKYFMNRFTDLNLFNKLFLDVKLSTADYS